MKRNGIPKLINIRDWTNNYLNPSHQDEFVNLAHVTAFRFVKKGQTDPITQSEAYEDCIILIMMGDRNIHVTKPAVMEHIKRYIDANLFKEPNQ